MAARMGARQDCLVVVSEFLEVWITTLSSVHAHAFSATARAAVGAVSV